MYNGTETVTFLGHRIWEIVSDYIKKSKSFQEFKLKLKTMEPRKLSKQVMQKVLTTIFFITCLLIFYAGYFIIFKSHFLFCQFCLLLQLFKPSRQKPRILAKVCTWTMSQWHIILSKDSSTLGFLRTGIVDFN